MTLTFKKTSQQSNRQIIANKYQLLAQPLFYLVGISNAPTLIACYLGKGIFVKDNFLIKKQHFYDD